MFVLCSYIDRFGCFNRMFTLVIHLNRTVIMEYLIGLKCYTVHERYLVWKNLANKQQSLHMLYAFSVNL